jgi:hypothetical protein
VPSLPTNPPGLAQIAFRDGDYAAFRRAMLEPVAGELSIDQWRTQGQDDLAVMIAEWFAYLADIITFYDERIANESYLRTALLDSSAKRLIKILGYRPRPAIGATGVVAALVAGGQSAVLPKGLQIQSKPAPGQQPQIFELSQDTPIGPPDMVGAVPAPHLLAPLETFRFENLSIGARFAAPRRAIAAAFALPHMILIDAPPTIANHGVLMLGGITAINPGDRLLLRIRDASTGGPFLATVAQARVQVAPGGGKQTALALAVEDQGSRVLGASLAASLAAADASLDRANQSIALWNLYSDDNLGSTVHLASLARPIRPGDWVLFTAPGWSFLAQVSGIADVIWDANSPADTTHPLPVLHSQLTLTETPNWPSDQSSVTAWFDWVSAGPLIDQPPGWWSGTPTALVAALADRFRAAPPTPVLLEDQAGAGVIAEGASAGDFNVQLSALPDTIPALEAPLNLYYNLLKVTRGKSVESEVLGSGNATEAYQSFTLTQSPVTWLMRGVSPASTVAVRVDGEPWTEAASFYGQAPDAQIFVTSEDVDGKTHVEFGDGINGARLPSGTNNIVADYRVGAGAASPAAGKLTVIAQPWPGLASFRNPVAVGGGADAEPAAQIRRYAPRSVLTFGRAVSVFDYEALAAQAPGVSRARATWSWSDELQRAAVVVYVGDDANAVASAKQVLADAGDPNRPVKVKLATPAALTLALDLLIVAGWDETMLTSEINTALIDPDTGLFAASRMAIGASLFDSQIEEAVLGVDGIVAIRGLALTIDGIADVGHLHDLGDGQYFTLDPLDLTLGFTDAADG